MDEAGNLDLDALEDRKKKEIEHTERRRKLVSGYEYFTDTSEDSEQLQYINIDHGEEYLSTFSNMKYYSITRSSFAYRDSLLYSNINNKVALDYCCGSGEICLEMVKNGAKKVYGIDISDVATNNAKSLAKEAGVEKSCAFETMDAEHLTYGDNTFDLIHEYGALHHLELEAAFRETSRVLKPGGRFICTEALRHNPIIHWYRSKTTEGSTWMGRTVHLRTQYEFEHILGVPEIMLGKKYFESVSIRFFHLFALMAVPFRKYFFFRFLLPLLEILDNIVLRIPYIQRLAWIAVIEYKNPK
jgi:ubiquinone/menaquinone biosynthesis C-methylase UbiE